MKIMEIKFHVKFFSSLKASFIKKKNLTKRRFFHGEFAVWGESWKAMIHVSLKPLQFISVAIKCALPLFWSAKEQDQQAQKRRTTKNLENFTL